MCKRTYFVLFLLLLGAFSIEKLVAQCNPIAVEIQGNGIDEDCDGLDGHYLHLPKHIYSVQGKSFELFFKNIALSTHPTTYTYTVVSSLAGQNLGNRWVITPTAAQVGNHAFTVQIKHSVTGQVLASATTTVHVAPAQSPKAGTPFKTIIMGHSMVDQGILPNFVRTLGEEPGNPSFTYYGTRTSWIDNFTKHQGKGGASWRFFYEDAGSPYVFNGQLDLPRYFNENVCFGCQPDLFVIELGGNDYLFQGQVDGTYIPEIEAYIDNDMAQNVLPFIQALRTAAPNMKIAICFEIPGNGRPNVFPTFFGAGSPLASYYRWRKIANTILFKYSQYFGDRENENLYLVPIHAGVDDINHFGSGDPVHPFPAGSQLTDPSGYISMSKQIYAWMRYVADGQNTGGGATKIDLALSMTGSETSPKAYQNFSTTLQISNTSSVAATNVRVHVPRPVGVVLTATPATATAGTFAWYSDEVWTIPNLPAQGNATLTVNYYTLTGQALAFYAQVKAADQSDIDSSPNNGNGSTANEDDETIFTTMGNTGGGSNLCDLELTIAGDASQANAFSNFSTTLTLKNKGQTAAQGIRIHAPRPALATYQGANAGQASSGSFVQWNDLWTLPMLAPNATATLKLNYFTLANGAMNFYAQVEAASPADVDSSPNNGNPAQAQEDDEALFKLNAQSTNTCQLTASGVAVRCENNGTNSNPNDDVYFFDLAVQGTGSAWTTILNGVTITGTYGQNRSMGPFPISGGSISLTVRDATNASCSVDVTVSPPSPCSSTNSTNCLLTAGYPWHEWISSVSVGTSSKTSDKSSYSDYSTTIFPMQRGVAVPFSVQTKFSFFTYTEYLVIWADLNQNGIFENTEMLFSTISTPPAAGSNAQKTIAGFLQIPTSTLSGRVRMRVALSRGVAPTACGTFDFGEVEDYSIDIAAAAAPPNTGDVFQIGTDLSANVLGDALLYPNPCYASTRISLKKWQNNALQLQILDAFGRTVWTKNYQTVKEDFVDCQTSAFPAGVYTLYARVAGQRPETLRLVVQE